MPDTKRGRPRAIRYNRGCLTTFIGGFFFAPAAFLLFLAYHSRNGEYCARKAVTICLPSERYFALYAGIGLIFLLGGIAAIFVMLVRGRR